MWISVSDIRPCGTGSAHGVDLPSLCFLSGEQVFHVPTVQEFFYIVLDFSDGGIVAAIFRPGALKLTLQLLPSFCWVTAQVRQFQECALVLLVGAVAVAPLSSGCGQAF
jgi:hypothetical protein